MNDIVIKVEKLNKIYDNGLQALKDVSFEVRKGEFLAVIGLSGSGKSTLLRCINGLIPSTSGKIWLEGVDMTNLSPRALRNERKRVGMIFQHFNLIPRKSVLQNVMTGKLGSYGTIPSILGHFPAQDIAKAKEHLALVGLKEKVNNRADELSGGQQQRVAIARTLMQDPAVLLADEPVASLDPATSHSVMDHLELINKQMGKTILCNLHFLSLVRQYATRVIALKGGELVFEGDPKDVNEDWFKKIYGDQAKEVLIH